MERYSTASSATQHNTRVDGWYRYLSLFLTPRHMHVFAFRPGIQFKSQIFMRVFQRFLVIADHSGLV